MISLQVHPRAAAKIASTISALLLLIATGAFARQATPSAEGERIHWKPVEGAQVKLDDKTPLGWNVYQPDKKDKKLGKRAANLVLLLLGHRYLYIDLESRFIYEVPIVSLQAHGADFDSADPPSDTKLVPSTDWTFRDVGPAEQIRLTLNDYGRALEISLPHPPDMRPFY